MAANTFNPTALANGTSNLLVRASALNLSTDLVQAGVVFNDATRITTGLFSTPQNSGNSNPFLTSYTTDLHAVQNDIAAMLANPAQVTLGGKAFTLNATDTAVLTQVQGELTTLINAAPNTANPATLAEADQTIHNVQAMILQQIQGDAHLSSALTNFTFLANTGAQDVAFQALPAGNDSTANLATATGGDLMAIGQVFNAAADLALGGISANNLGQITADFTAVQQGLQALLADPAKLAALEAGQTAVAAQTTTLHLQTILGQIGLQLNKYDAAEANASPTALRGTADNILDMIDVFQNDEVLNKAAGGTGMPGHGGGFSEMPGGLTGTVTKFQDNQVQTNFWASFLAEANTMGAKLVAVANGTATATQDLITQIANYQNFGVQFNNAQGAVFQGRFDNELAAGALQSDSAMATKALQGILNGDTGAALATDNAMLQAAAANFIGNAGDIGGNNMAIGGASYVGSATSFVTATSVNGIAMGTGAPAGANPNIANGTGGTPASTTTPGGGMAGGGTTGGGTTGGGTTGGGTTGGGTTGGGTTGGGTTGGGTAGGGTTGGNNTGNNHTTNTHHCGGHHSHQSSHHTAAAAAAATAAAATSGPDMSHHHAMHHMWG
ncbi:hypothetical protein S58_40020 [Bradyrhizobium oligotrophicum S58]|uniref:Uncharacterized protein n=1 Tax=Bradyrhizobium oligotrophicum S58 TaxID=1245469 RepID=M4Z8K5_9BRAD|nr:hypothetical protein [Bradyrhizobium oligotrophicum]BAM89988.1 hypothetical protein S58_40020 [Bradyrhizobium oligotrophicum S58]